MDVFLGVLGESLNGSGKKFKRSHLNQENPGSY